MDYIKLDHSHLGKFLAEKSHTWSPSTLKSERARLRQVIPWIKYGPQYVLEQCDKQKKKPYTVKMIFQRIAAFLDWAGCEDNPYRRFLEANPTFFRRSYDRLKDVRKLSQIRYADVIEKIKTSNLEEDIKEHALKILTTGARYRESITHDKEGYVKGKGGKVRRLFLKGARQYTRSYTRFYRALKKEIGLTPHQLRKLMATELARNPEVSPRDLMEIMGWTNMITAGVYLQPRRESKLKKLVGELNEPQV